MLGSAREPLTRIAEASPLATELPGRFPAGYSTFSSLFRRLVNGRNRAVHEGAYARNLTRHAIEVAIVLEDPMHHESMEVKHFMVSDPVMAREWEP